MYTPEHQSGLGANLSDANFVEGSDVNDMGPEVENSSFHANYLF
jgi:hypothetical protein